MCGLALCPYGKRDYIEAIQEVCACPRLWWRIFTSSASNASANWRQNPARHLPCASAPNSAAVSIRRSIRASGNQGQVPLTWPDHQARARTCPRHAGRSGLGHGEYARAIARFLSAGQGEARATCRRRRDGPQARRSHLAPLAQERKLRLGASGVTGEESSAHSNSRPGMKQGGAKKAVPMPITSRAVREQERRFVEQAEAAYAHFVAGWMPRGAKSVSKARTGAANEGRR